MLLKYILAMLWVMGKNKTHVFSNFLRFSAAFGIESYQISMAFRCETKYSHRII